MINETKNFLLDLFFPKFCLFCKKEGNFVCEDCFSLLEISNFHQKLKDKYLDDLYFGLDYGNFFAKSLIQNFKYPPLIKDLKKELSEILISHFKLINEKVNFSNFLIIPVPLSKRKLKWRGFNQSEEIAKNLAEFFKIPLISDCLIKIKETKDQVELSEKERKENVKNAFSIRKKEEIFGKNILLVDDVFTSGWTMKECARVLKESGAKKVIGVVLARAKLGQDKPDSI